MKTLIWQGIAFQSLEYFRIQENDKNIQVASKIIGYYENNMYTVDYRLTIDPDWNIQEFTIESEINTVTNTLAGKKYQNQWEINNTVNPDFEGFNFIDISLTPFTNTLPINSLKLTENEAHEIKVIYIDVLNNLVKPVTQQYTKIDSQTYHYDNLQTDFKADILVDENGLVIHYPKLFDKIAEI
jgi:hypothetical protein